MVPRVVVAENNVPPKIGTVERIANVASLWNNNNKSSPSSGCSTSTTTTTKQQQSCLVRRSPARHSCNPDIVDDDEDRGEQKDSKNIVQQTPPPPQSRQPLLLLRNRHRIAMYSYGMLLMMIYVSTLTQHLLHNTRFLHKNNDAAWNSFHNQNIINNNNNNHRAVVDRFNLKLFPEPITLETVTIPSWKELYSYNSNRNSRNTSVKSHHRHYPRVWPTNIHWGYPTKNHPLLLSNHSTFSSSTNTTTTTSIRRMTTFRDDCKPRSHWHTYTFPTCNTFHEMDWNLGLTTTFNHNNTINNNTHPTANEMTIQYLEKGGSRDTWIVQWNSLLLFSTEKVVLKTLRWRKQYDPVVYGHQRMDALALERLASSPHVVNIFGHCAMSTLNEYAEIGNFGKEFLTNPNNNYTPWKERLIVARDAALALAAVHDIDGPDSPVSMVHHDFSPKNLVVVNGKLKLSDFNDAKLRRWNFDTDKACSGFNWDGLCGSSTERTHRRSPEECSGDDTTRRGTDEKPEIYHLSSVFYFLLAEEEFPYYTEFSRSTGIRHKLIPSAARKHIISGQLPMLPPSVVNEEMNENKAARAIIHAMKWAYAYTPQDRPSAREVASYLSQAMNDLERTDAK